MHIVFVYIEAEMHILHVIQLILLFPFVCEAVGEVEWKRGPELPHLTLYHVNPFIESIHSITDPFSHSLRIVYVRMLLLLLLFVY